MEISVPAENKCLSFVECAASHNYGRVGSFVLHTDVKIPNANEDSVKLTSCNMGKDIFPLGTVTAQLNKNI
jgi:hypothetical protein